MKFVAAIRNAIYDSMSSDPEMHILGQGVWSPFYVGSSMDGIESTFGRQRVIDTPVSENAVTGLALGAAISGQNTLVIHPRVDFMILAMDPLVNAAAKWRYSLDFQTPIPLTIRAIVNRGGEQGAQHSQALHSWFSHIPGLRVVMPSSARDAYFLLRQSIECPDPVIFIEDRWSYEMEEEFEIPKVLPDLRDERPKVVSPGNGLTLVGIGHTTNICLEAMAKLENAKEVELIDVRILQPFDPSRIIESVKKTGRLIVVDGAWKNSGFAAEIIASVAEAEGVTFKSAPKRITLPDAPAPTSPELEKLYYLKPSDLAETIVRILMTDPIAKVDSWRYVTRIAFGALKPTDRRKIKLIALVQICLGLLDLLALAIMGLLGSMAVKGITSPPEPSEINLFVLREFGVISFQRQVAILGIIAAFFLIGRTLITMLLTRRTLFFLSFKSALLTANLVRRLLSRDLLTVMSKSKQETLFALTGGVNMIFVGLLGAGIQILADASLLLLMAIGLFIVDPLISVISIVLFGAISVLLYLLMHTKAAKLGDERTGLNIQSAEKIIEVMDTYREAVVRNRRTYYSDKISELRMSLARAEAEIAFMPSISKYVIEISFVIGAIAICGLQFALKDAIHAVATLAVFMTAGTRIVPAILRLQQSAIAAKTALSSASPSIQLLESLRNATVEDQSYSKEIETNHLGFVSKIQFKNVNFSYPGEDFALRDINFEVYPGEFVAIVGASGSGKTTLVDLLLGILTPSTGEVTISGLTPHDAIQEWPGAISYVPQDVSLIKGTVLENVGLGYDASNLSATVIKEALQTASIDQFVNQLPRGLNTNIGDGGQKLSGGQRQRVGIARSLITDPRLLVLDEATSALDGQTESDISNTIFSLRGKRTVVVIAHRLSSVRNADSVIYMNKGQILAKGNFDQVRSAIPDFDSQAKLMGL